MANSKVCHECGKVFHKAPNLTKAKWERRRFCSWRCYTAHRRELALRASVADREDLKDEVVALRRHRYQGQPRSWKRVGAKLGIPWWLARDLWHQATGEGVEKIPRSLRQKLAPVNAPTLLTNGGLYWSEPDGGENPESRCRNCHKYDQCRRMVNAFMGHTAGCERPLMMEVPAYLFPDCDKNDRK